MPSRAIIVGGGLAGLSAAHTCLERGIPVLLLDKNSFLGGNSTKATSGINGALTRTQQHLGIPDSVESFYDDTARSAKELCNPGLVRVLTYNSASAVEWLQDKFQLNLSLVSRLGGQSHPRTHRGPERFPGMTITYALMEKLEELAESTPDMVQIFKKAQVSRLLQDPSGAVIGVEYKLLTDNSAHQAHGVVVLATGGYAADFTETSLIKKFRPEIYDLPTTNGDWSTGDGIKLTQAIGGSAITLDKVQVHPTGLVDPAEPDAKVKFLAAEALRGVGGLLLDSSGDRFCDELGRRDYVTGEMWKRKKEPYRLVLNAPAAKEIEWHCKHYAGRGLMKFYPSGTELARDMGIPADKLRSTFDTYNDIAAGKRKDPFGKKFYANFPITMNQSFYVAIVCPVLHFTMGGVEIDPEARVLRSGNGPIPGLFAAGEVAGGVHGANRLGGSSLLGCVVYGRVAGASAAAFVAKELALAAGGATATAQRRLGALAGHLQPQVAVQVLEPAPGTRVNVQLTWSGEGSDMPAQTQTSHASTSSAPPAVKKSELAVKPLREITADEVAKHNSESDCWVIINGQVLDVTKFLPDHPGGKKAVVIYAGRDATEEFNMLHKPDVIQKYAPETVIGVLKK